MYFKWRLYAKITLLINRINVSNYYYQSHFMHNRGWELNPEPIDCKFDALPLCHHDIIVYLCLIRLVDLQRHRLEF